MSKPQPLTHQLWEAVPRIQRDGLFITAEDFQASGYNLYRATALMLMELTGLDYEQAKEILRTQPNKRVSKIEVSRTQPDLAEVASTFAALGNAYGTAFGSLLKAVEDFADGFSKGLQQMNKNASTAAQNDFEVTA